MDFVSDALFDGRRLRALTVVDACTLIFWTDQRVLTLVFLVAFNFGGVDAIWRSGMLNCALPWSALMAIRAMKSAARVIIRGSARPYLRTCITPDTEAETIAPAIANLVRSDVTDRATPFVQGNND